jgi:energy-coupling factor transporter ATP-binding protein EcfA2
MTVAPHLKAIKISNFRSIVEPLEVPLTRKMTFLVGQNNSGKTGILRFLALLLNGGAIVPEDSSTLTTQSPLAEFRLSVDALRAFSEGFAHLPRALVANGPEDFYVTRTFNSTNDMKFSEEIFKVIDVGYFEGAIYFSRDFSQSSSRDANVAFLLSRLMPQLNFPKTIYVPGLRIILTDGTPAIPQFGQIEFPGNRISLNSVVQELASLDRPDGTPTQRKESQSKLAKICEFIAYCLEAKAISIMVPDGRRTIYVTIEDNEQPISNLGSGIEQLIVIGMGSFMFPNHIVLIDEPEIHFHPRTQKRMMKYLSENAEAKFVVATHSAAILDSVEADIVQVRQEERRCFGRTVKGFSDRYEAVRNLGHAPSELVLANYVIWVEGPSDRIYFKHWIEKLDPTLVEGTDYAIIFYGGAVLARHGFDDDDNDVGIADGEDLAKAISISRNFAVYMDSDRQSESSALKPRVERVVAETDKNDGMPWISAGREIENYIPESVLSKMVDFDLNSSDKFGRVVKSKKFDKVKFAKQAIEFWVDEWPFDLKARCAELVARIKNAR